MPGRHRGDRVRQRPVRLVGAVAPRLAADRLAAVLAAMPDESAMDGIGALARVSERVFTSSVTELLVTSVPELPAAQLVQIRSLVLEFAPRHGWVDS